MHAVGAEDGELEWMMMCYTYQCVCAMDGKGSDEYFGGSANCGSGRVRGQAREGPVEFGGIGRAPSGANLSRTLTVFYSLVSSRSRVNGNPRLGLDFLVWHQLS